MFWTRAEVADVFELTPMRITQLVQEGVLPKPTGSGHDPKKAVSAYLKHLRQKGKSNEQHEEEMTKLRLDNQLKRLRLEKLSGECMGREAVTSAWFAAGRQIRDTLENLPDRLSGPLAAETDQMAIFQVLRGEVHQVLKTLSKAPHVKKQKVSATI